MSQINSDSMLLP